MTMGSTVRSRRSAEVRPHALEVDITNVFILAGPDEPDRDDVELAPLALVVEVGPLILAGLLVQVGLGDEHADLVGPPVGFGLSPGLLRDRPPKNFQAITPLVVVASGILSLTWGAARSMASPPRAWAALASSRGSEIFAPSSQKSRPPTTAANQGRSIMAPGP